VNKPKSIAIVTITAACFGAGYAIANPPTGDKGGAHEVRVQNRKVDVSLSSAGAIAPLRPLPRRTPAAAAARVIRAAPVVTRPAPRARAPKPSAPAPAPRPTPQPRPQPTPSQPQGDPPVIFDDAG
jgi:hypothetical protein